MRRTRQFHAVGSHQAQKELRRNRTLLRTSGVLWLAEGGDGEVGWGVDDIGAAVAIAGGHEGRGQVVAEQRDVGAVGAVGHLPCPRRWWRSSRSRSSCR